MYDILPDILTQATEALAPTGVTGRTQWTWKALPEEVRLGGVVGSLRGKKAWKAIRNTMENMASVARYSHSWPHLGLGRQSTFEVGLLFSYQGGASLTTHCRVDRPAYRRWSMHDLGFGRWCNPRFFHVFSLTLIGWECFRQLLAFNDALSCIANSVDGTWHILSMPKYYINQEIIWIHICIETDIAYWHAMTIFNDTASLQSPRTFIALIPYVCHAARNLHVKCQAFGWFPMYIYI